MGSKTPAGSWRAAALAGIACLGLGVGAGLMLSPAPTTAILAEPTGPESLAVTQREFADARALTATPHSVPEWSAVTSATGTLRTYHCTVGKAIPSGSLVLVTDDRPVLALHLSTPPWRDLEVGVKGDDVEALQVELVRLGVKTSVDGRFGYGTQVAVRTLWEQAGLAPGLTSLPLDQLLWLAESEATPVACPLTPGRALVPDTPVFTAGGGLAAVALTLPKNLTPGDRVAVLDDLTAPVDPGGGITDTAFLDALGRTSGFRSWLAGDTSQTLTVDTRLADPVLVVALPSSALYGLSGSNACVIGDGHPLAVRVLASELGQVMVAADVLPRQVAIPAPEDAAPCR